MTKFYLLGSVAFVTLLLDQISKYLITAHFKLYESVPLFENFFAITYVRNKGAAFSLLANSSIRIPFFITVSIVASILLFWYYSRIDKKLLAQRWGFSLVFAGAIGNLIDRIRFGEVVDFLDAHWYQHHWPVFNIADSAICIGAALLLLDYWRQGKK